MKPALVIFLILIPCARNCSAQDAELRRQADQLMVKANAVSTSPALPNLERTETFHALNATSAVREGTFTRIVIQGSGRREEARLGDFHAINVWTQGNLDTVRTSELLPPEIETVVRITPIALQTFDDSDVVRSIDERLNDGRRVRCIEFDTIRGQKSESNELCVDATNGTLVSERLGDELIENSEFFPFAGALMPGKIIFCLGGARKLEISQQMKEFTGSSETVLAPPPEGEKRSMCKTARSAMAVSMPQPKAGDSGRDAEVVVRGMVERDGRIRQAVIQRSDRPDLEGEALEVVKEWIFTPAMCDGQPNTNEVEIVVRFRGR